MQHVEAKQGFLSDRGISQQQKADLFADYGCVAGDRGAHGDRPESQLIPGQQIAGEAQEQRHQQQQHAQHPVELARLLVGAGEEDAAHVQEDHRHHAVRRPAMHVAQKGAEGHRAAQVEHAVVRLGGGGHVVEHQQNARHDEDDEQEERDQSQPEGVERTQSVAVDLDRDECAGRNS